MSELQSRFCFPRENRIVSAAGFDATRRAGQRITTRHFILYVGVAAGGLSRMGMIVSRRTGNAVTRNRHKRLLRESFRRNRPAFPMAVDLVAIVKNGQPPTTCADYERDLLHGLSIFFRRAARA